MDFTPPILPVPDGFEIMPWNRGFGRGMAPVYDKYPDDGSFVRGFRVQEIHTNGMGNCHGGMLMSFADMVFGHAVSHYLNRWWVTVRMTTDFLSPAAQDDWVEGTSEILGIDERDFVTVRGHIFVGDRPVLEGTGIFKALQAREV